VINLTTNLITHDHRKVHPQVYGLKPGPTAIQQIPPLKYIAQDMTTAFHTHWAGRPEPIDEVWIVWKIVNQLKQMTKSSLDYKFKLMPPEIIWKQKIAEKWLVTQMMQIPDCITKEMYEEAKFRVEKKMSKENLPIINFLDEKATLCAHKLHVGHYKDTKNTLQEIKDYVENQGCKIKGDHREIYLTPAMDCHPSETWKTIVRVEIE
jgi:hypothetical protein